MPNIDPKLTPMSEWYDIVQQSQEKVGYDFDDELQSYLVLTLDHFTTNHSLSSNIIALDFLENANLTNSQDADKLRDVGEQCLILSGLFPNRVLSKNVSLHYLVGMGRNAYNIIAVVNPIQKYDPDLFFSLCDNFVGLMDILYHMRMIDNDRLLS